MLASTANRDSFEVTTPSEHEIRLTRLFDAPRSLVFEAMTKPKVKDFIRGFLFELHDLIIEGGFYDRVARQR